MRSKNPYDLDGAAAMRDRQNLFRVDVVLFRPQAPLACHGASGVDEYAVEVEENGRTLKTHDDNLSGPAIGEAIESGGVISEASF